MELSVDPGVLLTLLTLVAGITIYTFIKSRHIERMQQLKLGTPLDHQTRTYIEVKLGLLFIGIGIGILTAFLVGRFYLKNAFVLYPALSFFFGGIGLLISFFIVEQYKKRS